MIKNIVFDFGGVLLDLDYNRTYAELSKIMGLDITADNIPAHVYKVMLGYEKGEINTETFLWNLQKEAAKLTPQPNKLITAWNAMLLGWNTDRFDFLENLRKKYNVYLLSNTNELHIEWVQRDLKNNHGIIDFDERFFEQTFYSHRMKLRKPEIAIYDQVINTCGILPSETLFIDDNNDNVAAAKTAGWNSIQHAPSDEIIDKLEDYINQFA